VPIFTAPAKINLFLHITGKRGDGYHLLDSLVVFAKDLSDTVTIEASDSFSFTASGEFAHAVPEDNLVTRAAKSIANATGRSLNIKIHLEKNIPAGAGLGGGSADAAATVRGLEKFWDLALDTKTRDEILLSLGADVPACYHAKACRFSGIGEMIDDVPALPALPVLVIWPSAHSDTKAVFAGRSGDFSPHAAVPAAFANTDDFIAFLKTTRNDLTEAAVAMQPVVGDALEFMAARSGCVLARMSGSGSAVFGIFSTVEAQDEALSACRHTHPSWFTRAIAV